MSNLRSDNSNSPIRLAALCVNMIMADYIGSQAAQRIAQTLAARGSRGYETGSIGLITALRDNGMAHACCPRGRG